MKLLEGATNVRIPTGVIMWNGNNSLNNTDIPCPVSQTDKLGSDGNRACPDIPNPKNGENVC
jgi:hypothetical protein